MYFNIIQKGIYMKGTITRRLGFVRLIVAVFAICSVLFLTIPAHADEADGANNAAQSSGSWMNDSGSWWYKKADGSYATGWEQIGGVWYYFGSDGYMKTGWIDAGGAWYYMKSDGTMATGWIQVGGSWYFLDENGLMKTGWMQENGKWYYFNSNGTMKTGWLDLGSNEYYYFFDDGAMASPGWLNRDGLWYYVEDSGALKIGWMQDGNTWYLFQTSGVLAMNKWASYGGYWYYFDGSGAMQTGTITVDGITYDLGASGGISDPAAQVANAYSSATNYLILVNRSTHTVNIFQGSQGNWSTIKTFSCTDGVATPNGTFTLGGRTYHFGEEKGYTCWYARTITGDILFHSVLYYPNTFNLQDGRLGITASHGCIRLALENAKYIYDEIPSGTKVVIYQ